MRLLSYLLPWQFSPLACVVFTLALLLYLRGIVILRRSGQRIGPWRPFVFLLGLALNYAMLQTEFDYFAQHLFWVHRLQHLVLHHIGPALLVLSAPVPVLRAGVPQRAWRALSTRWVRRPIGVLWRALQHQFIAPALFVGLIYFWLIPSVHFIAMLSQNLYLLMNWSMLVDGILFWWMVLAPLEAQGSAAVAYGRRVIILTAVAIPQIVIGAYIALWPKPLYSIYEVCGRAWNMSPMLDQQIGGLLTWIPGAMMSALGVLVILHHVLEADRRALARRKRQDASAGVPA